MRIRRSSKLCTTWLTAGDTTSFLFDSVRYTGTVLSIVLVELYGTYLRTAPLIDLVGTGTVIHGTSTIHYFPHEPGYPGTVLVPTTTYSLEVRSTRIQELDPTQVWIGT